MVARTVGYTYDASVWRNPSFSAIFYRAVPIPTLHFFTAGSMPCRVPVSPHRGASGPPLLSPTPHLEVRFQQALKNPKSISTFLDFFKEPLNTPLAEAFPNCWKFWNASAEKPNPLSAPYHGGFEDSYSIRGTPYRNVVLHEPLLATSMILARSQLFSNYSYTARATPLENKPR
jgi:hypothetical protein